mgnify:CR=1 FL=1
MRLVRERDGKVLREWPASDSPGIGMVAGWPTTEQLFRAADRALSQVAGTFGDRSATPEEIEAAKDARAAIARVLG